MRDLANEVSTMETEVVSLREEIAIRRKNEDLLEFERDHYKAALAQCRSERDNFRDRASTIKAILDQTGASLVTAMQRYHESQRMVQEKALEGGDGSLPMFLSRPNDESNLNGHSTG